MDEGVNAGVSPHYVSTVWERVVIKIISFKCPSNSRVFLFLFFILILINFN